MPQNFCPNCGAERKGSLRFCESCRFDFWKAAEDTLETPPVAVPEHTTAPVASGSSAVRRRFVPILVVVILGLLVYGYAQLRADQTLNDLGDALASIEGSHSTPTPEPTIEPTLEAVIDFAPLS